MSLRRILREQQSLRTQQFNPAAWLSPEPSSCIAAFLGPADSPYEDGVYLVRVDFPTDYPLVPMKVKFLTKVFHPNVSSSGKVSVDILRDQWCPALTLEKVLLSLQWLLSEPNFEDVVQVDAQQVYRQGKEQFCQVAKEWNRLYAM